MGKIYSLGYTAYCLFAGTDASRRSWMDVEMGNAQLLCSLELVEKAVEGLLPFVWSWIL